MTAPASASAPAQLRTAAGETVRITTPSAATITGRFRAMGCAAEVLVHGGTTAHIELAVRKVEHLERCWTRFDPTSDICRINAAGGRDVVVDPSTIVLVEAMVRGWAATAGAFDPTLLAPLVGLGYDASWDDPTRRTPLAVGTARNTAPTAILVDAATNVVRAPAGIGLDAGGIGKGLAADLVAAEVRAAGAAGVLMSLGGDVCVLGDAPQDGGWLIGVADPLDDTREQCRVHLAGGGVATSGTLQRAWTTADGRPVHHLLDPATGMPVSHAVVEATVVAGTAAWAEVWTKAVLVRGPAETLPTLDRLGLGGRAVTADGVEVCNRTWAAFACSDPEEDRS
jgi:thiamine biosynthesis lipoprotein